MKIFIMHGPNIQNGVNNHPPENYQILLENSVQCVHSNIFILKFPKQPTLDLIKILWKKYSLKT